MGEFLSEAVEFSYRRRKEIQEEVAIDRECKKLEKVWKNRGLPVDRETLRSVASKDVFDMKSLNESLPSTSEKKPTIKDLRRKLHPKWPLPCTCSSRLHLERFERFKNCKHLSCTPMPSRSYHRTLPPDDWNLPINYGIKGGSALKSRATKLMVEQRDSLYRKLDEISSLQFQELPTFDVQVETSKNSEISFVEMNKDSDMNVRKIAFFNAPDRILPELPLFDNKDGNRKEHQNSDIENNHQNVGFVLAPVSKASQDMNLYSSCDSRRNPDFQTPWNCPRFQSSNKAQETFYKEKAFLEMANIRETTRELRKQRVKAMRSRIGVLLGDINGSKIENPSIKIDSKISMNRDYRSILDRLKFLRQKLMEKHTSTFRSRLSTGSLKSDKVVPD